MSSMIKLVCPSCLRASIRVHRRDLDQFDNPWVCKTCVQRAADDAMAEFHLKRIEDERKRQEAYQAGGE